MAPVSSLFLTFLISLFNLNGAVSISIAISLSPNSKLKTQNPKLSPLPYPLYPIPSSSDIRLLFSRLKPACPKKPLFTQAVDNLEIRNIRKREETGAIIFLLS